MLIVETKVLASFQGARIVRLEIASSEISKKARPGQFILVMVSKEGERIPLTVVDRNEEMGTITLIVQEVGFTTRLLGRLKAGDSLYSIVGPLGHSTDIKNFGTVVLIGGGVGIAEIYPVAKALKEAGNRVISVIGSRTKDLLILEEELKAVSGGLYVLTDDGSYGRKGFTTDVLKDLLRGKDKPEKIDLIYAVGPIPMMKYVSEIVKGSGVRTLVSLNSLMVDGTGMCGGCRVIVGGQTKFTCVDGPEFDAGLIDWDALMKRSRVYARQEEHICKLRT
ncbi:MAG: sulfide/dihydroorotate dehydrogenase-like FAD/NAD-binding protein [Candidatus Omnitrophica bacterium]|nr:sulfide/dihydroorotate dehydrogenase-like FAD/NAD-binding protein [Candidatus Omnitrophota bacterium]